MASIRQQIRIEVVDKDGWRKEFPFQKSIVHIGSNPRSDLVLEAGRGAGVASLHAQLIVSAASSGCQLVNLGDTNILLGPSGDQALPPRSVTSMANGTIIKLGDFTLTFYSDEDGHEGEDVPGGFASTGQNIGLDVSLPQTRLAANESLSGTVTVSNLGEQAGVQFDLELEGLGPDCYEIEPGPLLSSGAEEDIVFHIYHRGNKPLAGDCHITICATAPRAYPGEQATVSRTIQVLPFYHHKLRLVSLDGAAHKTDRVEGTRVSADDTVPAKQAPEVKSVPPSQAEDWWAPTIEETVPSPPEAAERALQVEEPAPSREEVEEVREMVVETVALPQVEEEKEPQVQTGPSAQIEEGVEQTPEAAAPVPVEDEEPPAPPQVLAVAPDLEEQELAPVAVPLSEAEAEPVLITQVGPPPSTEDWWSLEAEIVPEEEEQEEPPPEVGLPLEPEAEAVTAAEDWWSPEAQVSPEEQTEPQVLKLKASPPPEAEAELAAATETGPPSSAEDWWSSETAGDLQMEERAVLKLKASPAPETDAEPAQVPADPSPAAEDWWASGE